MVTRRLNRTSLRVSELNVSLLCLCGAIKGHAYGILICFVKQVLMVQASHVCLKDLSMVHGTHFYPLKEEVRSLLLFICLYRKKRIYANINHSS